jgi:hypothetical protein
LAYLRGAESIYLHVDIDNYQALSLYDRAGYEKVSSNHPMYYEFTKSLNLHDGATKGRNHYLLQKHLCEPTWLHSNDDHYDNDEEYEEEDIMNAHTMKPFFGFDVMA